MSPAEDTMTRVERTAEDGGLPWNETNPEWWQMNVEERSKDGQTPWAWLVNEHADLVAVANAAQRYAEHAGGDGEDADDVCFANLLVRLGEWAEVEP